jgi:Transposase IS66 family
LSEQLVEQQEVSGKLRLENQALRDEIARLKGQKGKPEFKRQKKASHLEKKTGKAFGDDGIGSGGRARVGKKVTIDETRVVRVKPPEGSRFLGYSSYDVQDIHIKRHTIRFSRERWLLPDGTVLLAPLPVEMSDGHYGPELRRLIVYLHHHGRMPQGRIVVMVRDLGIIMSSGHLDAILQREAQALSDERSAMVTAGVTHAPYIQVDDTGARHRGKNGFCTHLGNPYFAAFYSTESKSRINFLNILGGGKWIYRVDDICINQSGALGLSQFTAGRKLMAPLAGDLRAVKEFDHQQWNHFIQQQQFTERERLIASEAALYATMRQRVSKTMAIISDDAGQFRVLQHGLCWVHAERKIHHLIPLSDDHRQHQERTREQIWTFYRALKRYKKIPNHFLLSDAAQNLTLSLVKTPATPNSMTPLNDCTPTKRNSCSYSNDQKFHYTTTTANATSANTSSAGKSAHPPAATPDDKPETS